MKFRDAGWGEGLGEMCWTLLYCFLMAMAMEGGERGQGVRTEGGGGEEGNGDTETMTVTMGTPGEG